MMEKCKQCQKEFEKKADNHVFCSPNCKMKWHYANNKQCRARMRKASKEYYESHKNNKEFKRKNYERTKKWIQDNRPRFNELIRDGYHRRKVG